MDLTPEDKKKLLSTVEKLRELDVYKAGQIFDNLSGTMITSNENLLRWVNNIKNSVFSGNQKQYYDLLEQVVSEN